MKNTAPRATLTTEAIETLLRAAIARARELDIRVHIAITDSSAEIVGFFSCEGAPRIAATTARHKAFTAVQTGMPTTDWKAYPDTIPADELKIIDKIEGYIAADGGLSDLRRRPRRRRDRDLRRGSGPRSRRGGARAARAPLGDPSRSSAVAAHSRTGSA